MLPRRIDPTCSPISAISTRTPHFMIGRTFAHGRRRSASSWQIQTPPLHGLISTTSICCALSTPSSGVSQRGYQPNPVTIKNRRVLPFTYLLSSVPPSPPPPAEHSMLEIAQVNPITYPMVSGTSMYALSVCSTNTLSFPTQIRTVARKGSRKRRRNLRRGLGSRPIFAHETASPRPCPYSHQTSSRGDCHMPAIVTSYL